MAKAKPEVGKACAQVEGGLAVPVVREVNVQVDHEASAQVKCGATAQVEGRTGAQVERQADEPELPAIDELYLDYLASYCDMLVVERNSSQHTVRNYRLDLLDGRHAPR